MSKKRSIKRAQGKQTQKQESPAPRLIQQISFSATYDVSTDRVESFSASPASLNPLAFLRALHALEMQLMATVMKTGEEAETPPL